MSLRFHPHLGQAPLDEKLASDWHRDFLALIERPEIGFFRLPELTESLEEIEAAAKRFADKRHFVHVGIGGSSLGPEMLLSALKTDSDRQFHFLNNIDPDAFHQVFSSLPLEETVFFVVSKSGGTAETLAALAIILAQLDRANIPPSERKNYLVFATDPEKGELRALAKAHQYTCLTIPPEIGGRFSVLTSVGLFPALIAGINGHSLLKGAQQMATLLRATGPRENPLTTWGQALYEHAERGRTQTVLMPYSSKLKDFSAWFVQLWAESLGKKHNLKGELVHTGLTPIAAYGATDQHSQMQLFMHGPNDKVLIVLEIETFAHDYSLERARDFQHGGAKLAAHGLAQLMKAELHGTLKALREENRPYLHLGLSELNEENLGGLILFFEALTAFMGQRLNVDPFDQPGVEAGKRYAFECLEKL